MFFRSRKMGKNNDMIYAPVDGETINITEVNDDVFSKKLIGDGLAVYPKNNQIYAPIDGEVVYLADSKHAIGFKTTDDKEVLLHMGLETVLLKGEGFDIKVKKNQKVKRGTLIAQIALDKFIREGFDPVIIIVNTNGSKLINKQINCKVSHNCIIGEIL